jgi:hypothetical protein
MSSKNLDSTPTAAGIARDEFRTDWAEGRRNQDSGGGRPLESDAVALGSGPTGGQLNIDLQG